MVLTWSRWICMISPGESRIELPRLSFGNYLGALVFDGPALSTITSYSCFPFYTKKKYILYLQSKSEIKLQLRIATWLLTNITGKKWTCPSGFVWVSLKYTKIGKFGHQSSQLTKLEYLLKTHSVKFWNQFF